MALDPRAEPRYGERVPYVVVCGGPSARLMDLVVSPHELVLNRLVIVALTQHPHPHSPQHNHSHPPPNSSLKLNGNYYISKQIIPALARVLNLVGADVQSWYDEMPRTLRALKNNVGIIGPSKPTANNLLLPHHNTTTTTPKGTIDQYYLNKKCVLCDKLTSKPLCDVCMKDKQASYFVVIARLKELEKDYCQTLDICMHCTGTTRNAAIGCNSLDCEVFCERTKAQRLLNNHESLREVILDF